MTDFEKFHKHLDECRHCNDHPFDLCKIGKDLLEKAAEFHETTTLMREEEDRKWFN